MNSNINILRKRNLETYKEVQKTYQNSNKALVVQATGTGKSFLAIQLLLDNLGKKPLFLCPLNGIISQLEEHIDNLKDENGNYIMLRRTEEEKNNSDKTGVYEWEVAETNQKLTFDMHTYAWLNNKSAKEIEEMDYDLVITDEAHRIGAPEWKKNMEHFLQTHQDSQLFGITATPVRERGKSNQFDISDESFIFDGNIIQGETLEEALLNGDLPMPTYINTSVQLLGRLEEIQYKVEKRMADSEEKREILNKIKQARKKLDLNESIPQLLARHLKPNGKYIVFCNAGSNDDENIKDIVKKMELANVWFGELTNEENMEIYKCTYDSPKASQSAENFARNLDKNGNDVSNKLRLMYAVNKYNEGIHVDDIDGVIMTRYTDSEIIYYQQLGRCLAVGKKSKPVVVDLAGNFEFAKQLKNKIKQERKRLEENRNNKVNSGTGSILNGTYKLIDEDEFTLIDEYIEVEEFIEILTSKLNLTDQQKKEEYIAKMEEINGVIISGSSYQFSDGTKMTIWYVNLKKTIKKIKEKQKQGKELTDEEQEKIEIYEEIEKVRKKYNIEYQRKEEYIAKMEEINGVIISGSSYQFSDGTKMAIWYTYLKQTIKKIKEKQKQGKKLKEKEQEKIEIYEEIGKVRKKYNIEYQRKEEYIAKMEEINGVIISGSSYQFSDGTKMTIWYVNLKQTIKKIKEKQKQEKELTDEEQEKIEIYEEIEKVRKKYEINIREQQRKEEYIAKMEEIKSVITRRSDYSFSDGMKMGSWYNNLKQTVKRIEEKEKQGKELIEETQEKLEIYEEIEKVRKKYNIEYQRKEEYIAKMEEIKSIITNTSSYQFSDGTKMGSWYKNLKQTVKRIEEKEKQGKKLTEEEEEKLEIYEEIEKVRKKYNIEYQRKEEYIAKMAELDGVINQRSDYKFSDGTKMGTWYPKIKQTIKKIKEKIVQGKELEEEEQEKLEIHQEIEEAIWNLGYKASCEYVSMYKDLHPIKYKTASKYELSKWLDEQRINYQLQNKDEVQLQHEQKLFELYPGWLYKTKDQCANSIVNQLSMQPSETIEDTHTHNKKY